MIEIISVVVSAGQQINSQVNKSRPKNREKSFSTINKYKKGSAKKVRTLDDVLNILTGLSAKQRNNANKTHLKNFISIS